MRYIEIAFQATDAVGIDKTECSLDGAAFTSCTSPVVYDRLSRDTHQVTVRATDVQAIQEKIILLGLLVTHQQEHPEGNDNKKERPLCFLSYTHQK